MNHNVETTHVEDGSGGVPEMNHNVETTPVEDGSGGVPEMNHNVETTYAIEDGSGGVPKTNYIVETTPRKDEDNGVHTMDHTLETNLIEDEDGGASTKDNLLGVALEVEHEEVSLQIDTLDSKIEVHEEEDCRKDDKLNEVSDGDAQSSNENDAGLLGRGHRKRKPAPSKCTPYTDPSKWKKLTNVIQFDAYRVVDSSKKDNLDKWLEKVVDGEELHLPFCNVSRKFFDELLGEGWLMSDHIDIALYHIRERSAQYPQLFDQNSCILDTRFLGLMDKAERIICHLPRTKKVDKLHSLATFFTNNRDVSCVNHLVRYVDGESPELGKAWKGCRFLYIPWCVKSHWIALRVDIQERKIEVYNNMGRVINREKISVIENVLPKLICAKLDENYGLQSLSSESIACPQQSNGFETGLKYQDEFCKICYSRFML
ncbi:hypothetical protein ACS0TY_005237 [Phlomoides rotata]